MLRSRMGQMLQSGPERWVHQSTQNAGARLQSAHKQSSTDRSKLSELYQALQTRLERGSDPSEQDVQQICRAIESVPLNELGIEPALAEVMTYKNYPRLLALRARSNMKQTDRKSVTYLHIHEDANMTIGIFQLSEGARIPLHNHPGMTVFSRLLYGTLHIRSYDWLDGGDDCHSEHEMEGLEDASCHSNCSSASSATQEEGPLSTGDSGSSGSGQGAAWQAGEEQQQQQELIRPARLITDQVLTAPADTSVLFPNSGGNIHAFTAVSPCAILDVLTPPYAPKNGRDCTYYREVFPPMLMDPDGQSMLVPSEQVSEWARWHQTQSQPVQDPKTFQQLNRRTSLDAGPEPGQQQDVIVGLQEWPAPDDFYVRSGTYNGLRVSS